MDCWKASLRRCREIASTQARTSRLEIDKLEIDKLEIDKLEIDKRDLGWLMGFEPTTTGITIRDSTAELQPPPRKHGNTALP